MSKAKKLWTPLSTFLRRSRAVRSTTCRFASSTTSLTHSPASVSSSTVPKSPSLSASPVFHCPWNFLQVSWKNYSSSESSPGIDARCWSCNAAPETLPFLVCHSCRTVQPVDHSVDYFQIFGLETRYEIEDANLEKKYKDWQKKLHPDLVHSKSEKERGFAAEQSARVIDAYHTLSNPRLRAIYILKLEGVDVDEEETVSEPQLLTEVMEIREAVEEAPDSRALNNIRSSMHEKLKCWSNSFAKAFQSRRFEEAITCIQRMTYYDRVNEEIVKKL